MNASLRELDKQKAISDQEAVSGLRIYKTRLASDDGWRYVAARNVSNASELLDVHRDKVCVASHGDLVTIAARALTGRY